MERKLGVLVVDDEQVVLDSIRKHLQRANYAVHTVLSAKQLLNELGTIEFDIILTDLMMPEIDGLELLKLMKERLPHTPVIMITGYATISTALTAMQRGAFDYVAKPFTRSELLSVVNRASELVLASEASAEKPGADKPFEQADWQSEIPKTLTAHGWTRLQDDGEVLMGVEKAFLESIGKIQNVFLPSRGDELRQGGAYLRIFSTDLRTHTVLSPLSGTVVDVNEKALKDPAAICSEKPEDVWLIRLKPSKFELEIKDLEL
jgi:FixJ family two-component response regulator